MWNLSLCSGDGNGFLLTGSADKTFKLWDIPSSRAPKKKQQQLSVGPGGVVRAVTRFTTAAHEKDINAVGASNKPANP